MSRHWRSHLVAPLLVGIVFESLNAWAALRGRPVSEFGAYLISPQGLISHLGILSLIITFLCVAVWYVHQDAKPPWTNEVGTQLDELLNGATSFFATCTIPLADWFHPDTQRYFSHLLKSRLAGKRFPQHRVLLFKDDRELAEANEQYLGAHYSKSLAEIHRNYEIPLGYLKPNDILDIMKSFDLTGRAAGWKNPDQYETAVRTGIHRETISTLDFGIIGYGDNQYKVYTFDKTGDSIKLEVIVDVEPYLKLRDQIRTRVFNNKGLPNANHNFASYCGV